MAYADDTGNASTIWSALMVRSRHTSSPLYTVMRMTKKTPKAPAIVSAMLYVTGYNLES